MQPSAFLTLTRPADVPKGGRVVAVVADAATGKTSVSRKPGNPRGLELAVHKLSHASGGGGARGGSGAAEPDTDKPGGVTRYMNVELPAGFEFADVPHIDEEQRDVYYISGPPGIGKSWFIAALCKQFKKRKPDSHVWLISEKPIDPALDSLTEKQGKPERLSIERMMIEPPDFTEFAGDLVILDDCDALTGPAKKFAKDLTAKFLDLGRNSTGEKGDGITVAIVGHQSTNYNSTRHILSLHTKNVVWPEPTAENQYVALLRASGLYSEHDRLLGMGRADTHGWVAMNMRAPRVFVSRWEAQLIPRKAMTGSKRGRPNFERDSSYLPLTVHTHTPTAAVTMGKHHRHSKSRSHKRSVVRGGLGGNTIAAQQKAFGAKTWKFKHHFNSPEERLAYLNRTSPVIQERERKKRNDAIREHNNSLGERVFGTILNGLMSVGEAAISLPIFPKAAQAAYRALVPTTSNPNPYGGSLAGGVSGGLEKAEEKELTDTDMRKLLGSGTPIHMYPELGRMDTLYQAIGPDDIGVVLYLTAPQEGHWMGVFYNASGFHVFDPYGIVPDNEGRFITSAERKQLGETQPLFHELAEETEGPVHYNKERVQVMSDDVSTCGRHVAVRLWHKEMDEQPYTHWLRGAAKERGLNPDQFVTVITNAELGR